MDRTEDDSHERRTGRRVLAWLTGAGIGLSLALILLALWLPYYQVERFARELRGRRALRDDSFGGAATWLEGMSQTLEKAGFVRIVGADLSNVALTDDDVERLSRLPSLEQVALYGRGLSVRKLQALAEAPSLREFALTDCPEWTELMTTDVKAKNASLRVTIRGQVFLGISAVTDPAGCVVTSVAAGSPAALAGIMVGERIVAFDGTPVGDFELLVRLIGRRSPGDPVRVVVRRGEEERTVTARLRAWRE